MNHLQSDKDTQVQHASSSRGWRWCKGLFLSTFFITLIILATLVGLINSELGTRWLIEQVEQRTPVTLRYGSGTVFSDLLLKDIRLDNELLSLYISEVQAGIDLNCMWEQRLCVKPVKLKAIQFTQRQHPPTQENKAPDTNLSLHLPWPIYTQGLRFDTAKVTLVDGSIVNLEAFSMAPFRLENHTQDAGRLVFSELALDVTALRVAFADDTQSGASVVSANTTKQQGHIHQGTKATASSSDEQVSSQVPSSRTQVQIQAALQEIAQHLQLGQAQLQELQNVDWASYNVNIPKISSPIALPKLALQIRTFDLSAPILHKPIQGLQFSLLGHLDYDLVLEELTLNHPWVNANLQAEWLQDQTHSVALTLNWHNGLFDGLGLAQQTYLTQWFNTLSVQSQGKIYQPELSLETTGLFAIEMQAKLALDNLEAPQSLKLKWEELAYNSPTVTVAIPSGNITVSSTLPALDYSHDISISNLRYPQAGIALNDISSRCEIVMRMVQIQTKTCNLATSQHTLPIDFTLNANQALFNSQFTLKHLDGIAAWEIAGQTPLSALRGIGVEWQADTAVEWDLSVKIEDLDQQARWQITQQLNVQDISHAQWSLATLHSELRIQADNTVLNIEHAPLQLALKVPSLNSQLDIAVDKLSAVLGLQTGTIKLAPIALTIAQQAAPDAPFQTDASMRMVLHSALSNSGLVTADINAQSSAGTWRYGDMLAQALKPATFTGELRWHSDQPISTALANMRTLIEGDALGRIGVEIDYTDKVRMYLELFEVNLALAAPFAPQLETLSGIASANLGIVQSGQDIAVAGVIIVPELYIVLAELPPSVRQPHADIVFTQRIEQPFSIEHDVKNTWRILPNINIFIDPLKANTVNLEALDFRSQLQGYVNLNGTLGEPLVMGDIALNNGQYQAYGQDLLIRQGKLVFTGPVTLPLLELQAIRNPKNMVDNTIAGIEITGTPNQLKATLFSEPMLENPNILSYLVRGKPLSASADEDNSVILTNALLGFGLGRSESSIDKFGDKLGVEDLQLSTQGQGEATQLGVSGKLNDRLSVEYRVGVFNAVAEFGLRYQWTPQLYVEATSGANSALDVFYQLKWGDQTPPNTMDIKVD